MKITRVILGLALLALLSILTPAARAGGVQAKHIAADAKWYIHLDFEAAKQTTLYTSLLEAVRAQGPVEEMMDQLKAAIGVNPLTDISGVTVYNNSFEKDVAAIIFYAKVDQFMLQQALSNNPEYKQQAHGKHSIQTWIDANDGKNKAGCFFGDGIVVLADKVDTVKMALDVLDGKKPGESTLVKQPAKGAFLYASALLAEAPEKKFSQLLSATDAATISAVENEGKLRLSASLTAKTAEQAAKLKMLVEGLKALVELATAQDQPMAAKLIREVKTTVDGAKVLASFEHDSKSILQTLQELDKEKKAMEAKKAAGETTTNPAVTPDPKK